MNEMNSSAPMQMFSWTFTTMCGFATFVRISTENCACLSDICKTRPKRRMVPDKHLAILPTPYRRKNEFGEGFWAGVVRLRIYCWFLAASIRTFCWGFAPWHTWHGLHFSVCYSWQETEARECIMQVVWNCLMSLLNTEYSCVSAKYDAEKKAPRSPELYPWDVAFCQNLNKITRFLSLWQAKYRDSPGFAMLW